MFTGLIVEMGAVISITKSLEGARLRIKAEHVYNDAEIGDSIALNGTCLTVVEKKDNSMAFDMSDETLKSTNLGQLKKNDPVNLEPSLRLQSKIGGHFVTGHIDGLGRIKSKDSVGDVYKIVVNNEECISDLLVTKGSVAVDGISLTVVDVYKDGFSVVIIPHTAHVTTLGFKKPGDTVNIEVDILGKYVSKFLHKGKNEAFMQTLMKEGFI
ncbi:MAG: riboflavin synthase [Nitrospiraceae bacterium]|nr:MAG: riboflavin synthase [Nitrospiraceae bacterium]